MVEILLTAAEEDAEDFTGWIGNHEVELLHLPLERYLPREWDEKMEEVFNRLEDFENIIYRSKKNATFFLDRIREMGKLETVQNRLNLAVDETTAQFLEDNGIPAVRPPGDPKPIDLLEYMLRLRRVGESLYPCGSHDREDLPGFLEELDIAVTELELYDLAGPPEQKLDKYREILSAHTPDIVILHSRRAVTRISAAFPELDLTKLKVLTADTGITEKLQKSGIGVDAEGAGSWFSVYETLLEEL